MQHLTLQELQRRYRRTVRGRVPLLPVVVDHRDAEGELVRGLAVKNCDRGDHPGAPAVVDVIRVRDSVGVKGASVQVIERR